VSNLSNIFYRSKSASISDDGRYVAFQGQNPYGWGIYAYDRVTEHTESVDKDSDGNPANNYSWFPHISGNGWLISFGSPATNLVPEDYNGKEDVFVNTNLVRLPEPDPVSGALPAIFLLILD
jgi:hypothetical protein